MAELTIDMTYGSALYQAAKETGIEEQVRDEGRELMSIFKNEPQFYALFIDPTISAEEKKTALKNVFEGRISEQLLNFLYVLEDKGRARHFEAIMREYCRLLDEEEGVAAGTIYSVEPLSSEQLEKFQQETGRLINEKVKLDNITDPELIGGVRILVNGKLIDASLRKRLDNMKESIR